MKKPPPYLTADRLRELLEYDPATGHFEWRNPIQGACNSPAGCIHKHSGYRIISHLGRRYRAQRLVWLYVHGEWPPSFIDHIDRNPANNRLANLRLATPSQNLGNKKRTKRCKAPLKGCIQAPNGRWRAYGGKRSTGKNYYLGTFDTIEEAHAAYITRAREDFGEFARAA